MNTPILHRATAFISSTFADMAAERDLMMYRVLPKLKKWAFDRGIIFDVVDLRWGINDEQARDLHHTVKICLKKVQESDPLFICFLGERYGWIPEEAYFNQAMFQRDIGKYTRMSATELEIAQALDAAFYEAPPKSCMFLLREPLDTSGVSEEVRAIYVEDGAREQLCRLRAEVAQNAPTLTYRATLQAEGDGYALTDLKADGVPLEELLLERVKTLLTLQYHLDEDAPTITEDVLIRQQYHLRQSALLPRIEDCHAQMRDCLEQMREHEFAYVGIPRGSALQSQIAQFILDRQSEGQRVIYRFRGIDPRLETVPELITSLAYELSGNADYSEHTVEALYYVKAALERAEAPPLLVLVGLPTELLDECVSVLSCLKFDKSLIFVEVDDSTRVRYCLSHSERSFEALAEHLFEKHAKVLSPSQMARILAFVDGDDALLQTVVTYLCSFATYATLDGMIEELEGTDKATLTERYVDRIISIQNRHEPVGIMELVLELLCHTPLPITEEDLTDVICLYKTADGERGVREEIQREVAFSLAFARDFIVEYHGRFKIYDKTLTDRFLFCEHPEIPAPFNRLPAESVLLRILRTEYVSRLWSEDRPLESADAENLVEIVKDYSDPDFKRMLHQTVLEEPAAFYRLARALGKRGTVDLMKTLAMQSLGMDVDSYCAREMRRVLQIEHDPIGFSQSIMGEKRFSVSRKTHRDNPLLYYYDVALALNSQDLATPRDFTAFLDAHAARSEEDVSCHFLRLPKCLRLTPHNITAYTVFDAEERAYESYFCHCDNGFVIICDAFTGELRRAYAIPYCGEIISTFYQEETLHIVSDQGILIAINLLNRRMELHRFAEEGKCVGAFSNCYGNGYQFAVINANAIEFYRAIVRRGGMRFKDGWTVQSVYGLPMHSAPEHLVVTACDAEGKFTSLLIDPSQGKITYAYRFGDNRIVESLQNEQSGEVYLRSDCGVTYILRHDGADGMEVDYDTDRYCYASGDTLLCENEDGVLCNGSPVTDRGGILCGFASRRLIGFVTEDGRLCLIDNGY